MNKSNAYSLIAVAFLVAAFIGVTIFVEKTETDIANQTAAIIGSVSGVAGQPQVVSWNASEFPAGQITINLIRKVSDNPASYEFVRTIATVENTGSATWTPTASEIGDNMFIEVICPASTEACVSVVSATN